MNNKIIDLDALTEFSNKTKEYIGPVVRYLEKTKSYNTSSKALDITNWQVGDRYVLKLDSNAKTIYFKYKTKTYSVELCPTGSSIVNGEFYLDCRAASGDAILVGIICGISVKGHLFHHYCNIYPNSSTITDGMNIPFEMKQSRTNVTIQGTEHLIYTGMYANPGTISTLISEYLIKINDMTNFPSGCLYIYFTTDDGYLVKLSQVSNTGNNLIMSGTYTSTSGGLDTTYRVSASFTYSRSTNADSAGIYRYTVTDYSIYTNVLNYTPRVQIETYRNTWTYSVGDYTIYNSYIYKCNTAISTPENWNSAHWDAKTYIDYLRDTLNS